MELVAEDAVVNEEAVLEGEVVFAVLISLPFILVIIEDFLTVVRDFEHVFILLVCFYFFFC